MSSGTERGRRWWSRLTAPDATVVSGGPAAARPSTSILRHDRPDVAFTSSPPESVHVLGLLLSGQRCPLGRRFPGRLDVRATHLRPYLTGARRRAGAIRGQPCGRGDSRHGAPRRTTCGRAVAIAVCSISRTASTPRSWQPPPTSTARWTLGASRRLHRDRRTDGKDPRPSYALSRSRSQSSPRLSEKLEVVFAGNFTGPEIAAMDAAAAPGRRPDARACASPLVRSACNRLRTACC